MAGLANKWAEKGWQVSLVTLGHEGEPFFPLHSAVGHEDLGLVRASRHLGEAIRHNFRRVKAIRRTIIERRPDVVISFQDSTNVIALLAASGLAIPVVISQRVHPAHHDIGRIWTLARRLIYRRADVVVAQTEDVAVWLSTFTPRERISVIPNFVESPQKRTGGNTANGTGCGHADGLLWIAAAGRLVRQKGFDLLLAAFARTSARFAEWRLVIYGDGPERATLERLARTLGIASRVTFAGQVKDLMTHIHEAQLFVLSSRFEGFPNVLLEAMACGMPVVSFDCDSGPRDIIRHGVDGLLVPAQNTDALASALERLMADEGERHRFATRAVEVRKRFSPERIVSCWETVLLDVCR